MLVRYESSMTPSELYDRVRFLVRSGLASEKEVFDTIKDACQYSTGDELGAIEGKVRGYAAKQLALFEEEEFTWDELTVNDRIDAAFEELNRAGIIALQNAGWTQSEGWEDSWEVYRGRKEQGSVARGAVFYHGQDTESGVEGHGLFLALGAFTETQEENDAATELIGQEIVQVLRAHGIACEWSGSARQRIHLLPFPWRKRRSSRPPPPPPPPPVPTPWQCFVHPDGRRWRVRQVGSELELRITLPDGDVSHRRRPFSDPAAAQAALEQLVSEQRADGFTPEVSD
jgi:hypothetical protein